MPERPLLLFPTPETADRSRRRGFPGHVHRPTRDRQGQRLSPIFARLQTAFNERRAEVQQTAAGADPEQTLVIETIGNVENFANAVKRIKGLEWMGEIETDGIEPDEDFYDEHNTDKRLGGCLYLVMSDQQALDEMLSLWQRYQNDQHMEFERGLTRFRDVFLRLKDIRRWSVQDRIAETGVLDAWQEDLEHDGNRPIRCEVELWFRGTDTKRRNAQEQVKDLVVALRGTILDDCIINDIAYHALLAEIPANAAKQIIEHLDVDLIKCDGVMFFRPVGQMTTGKRPVEGALSDCEQEETNLPTGKPIVAILDGLPLANHDLLQDRLIIDDPDDYASAYSVSDRTHGTAMASLVVHGDLSDRLPPLPRPVYVRPIMKPIPWIRPPKPEHIPNDVLIVDHIHRAVRRMFEGDDATGAVVPTIRIISFSIGDPCRQFTQALSPLARLLDWLSVKYRVLFIISAGNHEQDIETGMRKNVFDALSNEEKEAKVVQTLYEDARYRKLLSPGESMNGITVGALHHDASTVVQASHAIDLFESLLPSPVSAFGSGYRRAVKPDLLFNGGRVLYMEKLFGKGTDATFERRPMRMAPGNKVASPSTMAGELNKVAYCCGTSNATALTSGMASRCHDIVVEVFKDQSPDRALNVDFAPLLKAMIVHGCSWKEIGERLHAILRTPANGRQIGSLVSRWLGYGVPDFYRVLACTEQRATMLGCGRLSDEKAHVFSLPVPPSLGARLERRRLTVTLAWMSPIAANTQRYRSAGLWFEINDNVLAVKRREVDTNASRRGTVQHEIFEGKRAVAITDGANLTIKVNCRKDAAEFQTPVAYGLAVTLEVAEGIDIAIYEEIRARIAPAVEIRATEDG